MKRVDYLFKGIETPVPSRQGRIWKWDRVKGSPGLVDPCSVLASPGLAPATELEGRWKPRNARGLQKQASPMCALLNLHFTLPIWLDISIHHSSPATSSTPSIYIQLHFQACAVRTLCVSHVFHCFSNNVFPDTSYLPTLESPLALIPHSATEWESLKWLWQSACLTRHPVLQSLQ